MNMRNEMSANDDFSPIRCNAHPWLGLLVLCLVVLCDNLPLAHYCIVLCCIEVCLCLICLCRGEERSGVHFILKVVLRSCAYRMSCLWLWIRDRRLNVMSFFSWMWKRNKPVVRARTRMMRLLLVAIIAMVSYMLIWQMGLRPVAHFWLPRVGLWNILCVEHGRWLFWVGFGVYVFVLFVFWLIYRQRQKRPHFEMNLATNMLSHDRAISLWSQDDLRREPFVQTIRDVILRANVSRDAEYIGIFGAWGSGKTSVVNLLRREMSRPLPKSDSSALDHSEALFVDFNAWTFCNSDDAIAGFLRQLVDVLNKNNEKRAARAFHSFGRMNSMRRMRVKGGVFGDMLDVARQWYFSTVYNERITQRRVRVVLRSMRSRVVIVVDDLERMPSKDVGSIVSFLKANFDFPNVVVLFVSDDQHLQEAIARYIEDGDDACVGDGVSGRGYLEKIIPYQLVLPEIGEPYIMSVFIDGLKRLLSNEDCWRYDVDHDDGDEYETVRYFVKTIRDAKRLLNAVWTEIAFHRNATRSRVLNLHVGDLVALTTVKLWLPNVYHNLPSLMSQLVENWNHRFYTETSGMSEAELNKWLDACQLKGEDDKKIVYDFLKKRMGVEAKSRKDGSVEYVYSGLQNAGDEARYLFRLASYDYSRLYFEDFSNVEYLRKADLVEFDRAIIDKRIPKELFERLKTEGNLKKLIRTLQGQKEFSNEDETVAFFKSMLWLSTLQFGDEYFISDQSRDEASGSLLYSYDVYADIGRCIYHYLISYNGQPYFGLNGRMVRPVGTFSKIAGALLLRAAKEIPSCFLIWQFISWYKYDGPDSQQIFTCSDYTAFMDLYLDEVVKLHERGCLMSSPVFFDLMRAWNITLKRKKDNDRYDTMRRTLEPAFKDVANVKKILPFLERSEVKFREGIVIENCTFYGIDVNAVKVLWGGRLLQVMSQTLTQDKNLPIRIKLLSYALEFVLQHDLDENQCSFEKQVEYVRGRITEATE